MEMEMQGIGDEKMEMRSGFRLKKIQEGDEKVDFG
jgi:hypothetical protein